MTDASPPVALVYQGKTYALWRGRILLNWRDRPVLTRPRPCRLCRGPAHFTDDSSRPVHKTCLEAALTADLLTAGSGGWEAAA